MYDNILLNYYKCYLYNRNFFSTGNARTHVRSSPNTGNGRMGTESNGLYNGVSRGRSLERGGSRARNSSGEPMKFYEFKDIDFTMITV